MEDFTCLVIKKGLQFQVFISTIFVKNHEIHLLQQYLTSFFGCSITYILEKTREIQLHTRIFLPLNTQNINFKICSLIDIDDQELDQIESQKRARLVQELIENPPPYANPVQLVSKAADHIVLKIVNNVCHEAIEEDLVQKLVQAELKSFN